MTDASIIIERLDRALEDVLAARIALGGVPVALPDEALDEALRRDDGYQKARREFTTVLRRLLDRVGSTERDALLAIESTTNQLVARTAEVAFRLGVHVGRGD